MHPSQKNEVATLVDWLGTVTDEPADMLSAFRARYGEESSARSRLASMLPTLVGEVAPYEEGVLAQFVARAVPGMNWAAVADEVADRVRWEESRVALRELARGMRTKPTR